MHWEKSYANIVGRFEGAYGQSRKERVLMVVFVTIIHLICSLALVAVVILQSGKKSGLAAISGGNESYLSKNKSANLDAKLARMTKWVAIAFAVTTLVLNIII